MKFLILTRPIEGIEKKLPRPQEFEAQIDGFVSSFTPAASIAHITARTTTQWRSSMPSRARNWSSSMALCRWLNSPTARLKRSGVSSIKCREFWKVCVSIIYAELSERHEGKRALGNGAIGNRSRIDPIRV